MPALAAAVRGLGHVEPVGALGVPVGLALGNGVRSLIVYLLPKFTQFHKLWNWENLESRFTISSFKGQLITKHTLNKFFYF